MRSVMFVLCYAIILCVWDMRIKWFTRLKAISQAINWLWSANAAAALQLLLRSIIANVFFFSSISISNDKLIVDWATWSFYHCVNRRFFSSYTYLLLPFGVYIVQCTLFFIYFSSRFFFALTIHRTWFPFYTWNSQIIRRTHMVAKFFKFIACSLCVCVCGQKLLCKVIKYALF